jgi:hypothetical protein
MYWKSSGENHTVATVELAVQTATARGISHIVVASNRGQTALLLAGKVPHLVCVTHANGYTAPGQNELPEETRTALVARGVQVLTTTHVLSGVERGISKKFGGAYPAEIIANALRMFGQGVKVCVEISVMALDAGLIPYGVEIIAIGGSGGGADTALILQPAHAANIFDTTITEIICKP